VVVNDLWAVPLAAIAGLLFADTYERSRSTLLVSLQHAFYGDFVFSVGLGALFY
jgi:membrane protease YdiL (CAAX protease family)